ncbi:MAG TPA: 4'-phosphopantetheinyl transferase superfamily protein [Bryobacteraceae bacterium]|nr:4'-phosphopantetheinyl transferase superfamily protein [Bryobacteraceae bacterium]
MSRSEVQVWAARLDPEPERIAALTELLSEEERARAGRFYLARDSRRFVAARGLLRLILGRRLGAAPERLEFAHGAFGKPFLKDTMLRFNVADSADLALVAIAEEQEVGVDVELVRRRPEMHRIAERFFSARECAEFHSAPAETQTEVFFRFWTHTEARLKARGVGIGGGRNQASTDCAVYSIHPEAGYTGAVAMEGSGFDITLHTFGGADFNASCAQEPAARA